MKRRKSRAARVGQRHTWKYNSEVWREQKIKKGLWAFTYRQTKTRLGKSAPKGSGFPERGTLHWHINADQFAKKVSANKYVLTMKGKKRLVSYQLPRKRKFK